MELLAMNNTASEIIGKIDKLPKDEKLVVFNYIKSDLANEMNYLVTKLRKRAETNPISYEEISGEIESVREKNHENG